MRLPAHPTFRWPVAICIWLGLAGAQMLPVDAAAQSAGLAVVVANSYDGFLPASLRDADAVADKLEENGFETLRLLGKSGSEMAAAIEQVHRKAEGAGPVRLIYTSGFGLCADDDLFLLTDDVQPEQIQSGQVGDVVVPISVLAESISAGASQTLIVFDTNPRQCTNDAIESVGLPEKSALLITTGIGGDVVDEIDEDGMSAFATAFLAQYASEVPLQDIIALVVAEIRTLTEDQQKPIFIDKF